MGSRPGRSRRRPRIRCTGAVAEQTASVLRCTLDRASAASFPEPAHGVSDHPKRIHDPHPRQRCRAHRHHAHRSAARGRRRSGALARPAAPGPGRPVRPRRFRLGGRDLPGGCRGSSGRRRAPRCPERTRPRARGPERAHRRRRRPDGAVRAAVAAPRGQPVHRARGHHRGRVPRAAPGEGRARRAVDHRPGLRGGELPARARGPGRDRRLRGPRRHHPAPHQPGSGHLSGLGQGPGAQGHRGGHGGGHRRRGRGAGTVAAPRPGGRGQGQGHRPYGPDPGHLRPARQVQGGQGPGRAGPARVHAPAPARLGREPVPPGGRSCRGRRGHRLARSR